MGDRGVDRIRDRGSYRVELRLESGGLKLRLGSGERVPRLLDRWPSRDRRPDARRGRMRRGAPELLGDRAQDSRQHAQGGENSHAKPDPAESRAFPPKAIDRQRAHWPPTALRFHGLPSDTGSPRPWGAGRIRDAWVALM